MTDAETRKVRQLVLKIDRMLKKLGNEAATMKAHVQIDWSPGTGLVPPPDWLARDLVMTIESARSQSFSLKMQMETHLPAPKPKRRRKTTTAA